MTDSMIIASVGFLGGLIVLIAPILKLNSTIAKLTTVVEKLEELVKEKTDNLDKRVTKHGEEIDKLFIKQTEHETRIKQLEK